MEKPFIRNQFCNDFLFPQSHSVRARLPEVLGNKGTWPFTFREQGNKRKIKLGTREQKYILGNRKHQNRRNTFREQRGNTTKILLGTREHGPGGPHFFTARDILCFKDVLSYFL